MKDELYFIIYLTIIVMIIVLLIVGTITGRYCEQKAFNNGICPHCKSKLKNFDSDSQGGRGYTCKVCNYTTWVSYRSVDKNYKNF